MKFIARGKGNVVNAFFSFAQSAHSLSAKRRVPFLSF